MKVQSIPNMKKCLPVPPIMTKFIDAYTSRISFFTQLKPSIKTCFL